MPGPIGHALAGLIVAWSADLAGGPARQPTPGASWFQKAGGWLTFWCVLLAVVADLDLLLRTHRSVVHSITAVAIVVAAGWLVARGRAARRLALTLGAAYATHLLLDWVAADRNFPYGIQALWPLSHRWFIAGWEVFPGTERRHILSIPTILQNVKATATEILLLAPVAAVVWLVREKALARFAAQLPGGDHPSQ